MNIIYYDKLPSSLKNINFDFCIINLKYKKNYFQRYIVLIKML